MTNELYDKIKLIALLSPVLTCISAIVTIFSVPYSAQITAALAAISAALGEVVLIAKKLYDEKNKTEETKEGDSDE